MQQPLDFPGYMVGLQRAAGGNLPMRELTERYARALAAHRDDRPAP